MVLKFKLHFGNFIVSIFNLLSFVVNLIFDDALLSDFSFFLLLFFYVIQNTAMVQ